MYLVRVMPAGSWCNGMRGILCEQFDSFYLWKNIDICLDDSFSCICQWLNWQIQHFHACVKNMKILNIYILYRSSSIWILYWPHVEIMQPEFIWRAPEIHLLNSQLTPADGCIMTAQRWVSIYGRPFVCWIWQESTMKCNRPCSSMQTCYFLMQSVIEHVIQCLTNLFVIAGRRGKPGERDISAVKLQHVPSHPASHPGPLRKQGDENSQPYPSPAGGVSIKPPMTQLHEQRCPWTRHGWGRCSCLSHFNVICFGLGTSVTCYFNFI